MAKIQHSNREWRIIIETRHKYKYTIADVKKIIKLLCVDKQTYPEIFISLEERISIRHIKTVAYILKYGNLNNIRKMFIGDDHNPYVIKFMLARIKTVIKNFDRKEKDRPKITIFEKYEMLNTVTEEEKLMKSFSKSRW